jgi:hypothetical protein
MTTLSKSDQELVKLRAAKMSTKTIAMLMGGRWTEARVYNRLAQIDGQAEATVPDLPVLHRVDEDLPSEPAMFGDEDEDAARLAQIAALCRRTTRFPGSDHQVVMMSNPGVPIPPAWLVAGVDYGSGSLVANLVIHSSAALPKSFELARWPEHAIADQELPDASEAVDQPAPGADAAPDPEPTDAASEAGALHAEPAQAGGDQTPEAPDLEEAPPAPNPLAVEARPFVPVHQVRRRKAAGPVAAPSPNVLASPPPPPARQVPRGGALRLKPLTDRVAGYAARFLAASWPIDEIAWLFDVSPEALEKVLA